MAVIVRETRILDGESVAGVETFKSTRLLTASSEGHARRLDRELEARMRIVTEDLRSAGLISLRGKAGVLKLWWELGRRLDFVGSLEIEPPEDRKFVWRAIYDHSPELVPGPGRARLERGDSHFFYCAMLGRFEWDFVSAAGDWTSWTEFFDSERIREDSRILEWLAESSGPHRDPSWERFVDASRQNWVRPLAKAIRHRFKNRDTRILSRTELETELDEVFREVSDRDLRS